jgi:hypothetical protein
MWFSNLKRKRRPACRPAIRTKVSDEGHHYPTGGTRAVGASAAGEVVVTSINYPFCILRRSSVGGQSVRHVFPVFQTKLR